MLHKDHISHIEIYSDEWHALRVGKFTSSKMHSIMAQKPLTEGALTYIHQKAGEYITGQTLCTEDDIIEDENTVWGLEHEPLALNLFGNTKKIKYLVTQKVIHAPGTRFSSTPDGIWVIDSSVLQEDCYNVAPVEVKCPRKYPRFLELYKCNTPFDLKKESKAHFWQVLDQMDNCGSALGYYACYHPLFPAGKNMKIIEFTKIDLWDDFKLLQQRKQLALTKFNEIITEFST